MNISTQIADLEQKIVGINTVIKGIKQTLANSDQAPLKDKRGALTDAGKTAILAHFAGGGDQKSAISTFEVSPATARNYWHAHMKAAITKTNGNRTAKARKATK